MLELELDVASLNNLFAVLERFGQQGVTVAMERTAIRSERHAKDLLQRHIYGTPQRGNYVRTGRLRDSMRAYVADEPGGPVLYLVNDARSDRGAPYPRFVEAGTYGNRITPDQILEMSRGRMPTELVFIEFGRLDRGLEPRPVVYPTLAYAEYILPNEIADELLREWSALP